MLDLQAIIALNASAILLLVVVLINARTTIHGDLPDNKLFYAMSMITIVQAVVETVSYASNGKVFPGSFAFNVVVNDLLYINNATFAYLWVLYVDCKLFDDMVGRKKRYYILAVPALAIILMSIINLFVPIFFTVDAKTMFYQRSNLYVIPMIVAAYYLLYGLLLTIVYRTNEKKYLFFPALAFLFPMAIAVVVEYFFYGLNVMWIGAAISLTSIYINLQNQVAYTDPLSGLFTRQYLTRYLQDEMKRNQGENELVGMMIDIDRFKSINDTYGHLAGDEAIAQAGAILRQAMQQKSVAFRYGGDEMVVIQSVHDESETTGTIERIKALTKKFNDSQNHSYHLHFSIGYTIFDHQTDSLDDFLGRMDAAMYTEKMKAKAIRQ